MTQRRNVIHLVAILAAASFNSYAQAQDTGAPQQQEPADSSTNQGAGATTPGSGTQVEEQTGMQPSEPSTGADEPLVEKKEPRDLVPEGEKELVGNHDVDGVKTTFKPGKGLQVQSADGKFALGIRVRIQLRDTITKSNNKDPNMVFQLKQARLLLSGNMFSKDIKYKVEFDAVNSPVPIVDYFLEFTKKRDATVRVGQYELSSNRERAASSAEQQFVDRSNLDTEFSLERDLGVDVRSNDFLGKNKMRYVLGVFMGQGTNNFVAQDFGMLYLARFEYLPFGLFEDFSQADFERTRKARLAFAATYAFSQHALRTKGNTGDSFQTTIKPGDLKAEGGTEDMHFFFLDSMFKDAGFSLLGELALRAGMRSHSTYDKDNDPLTAAIPVTNPRNGIGSNVQAGYLIPRLPLEFVGRFGSIHGATLRNFGGDSTSLPDKFREVAGGINWYIARHPLKLQADLTKLWTNSNFSAGDIRFRVQLQASL